MRCATQVTTLLSALALLCLSLIGVVVYQTMQARQCAELNEHIRKVGWVCVD